MASTSRTTVGRRLGVLIAGAAVLTALSVATAGAAPSAPMGVRAAGLARLGAGPMGSNDPELGPRRNARQPADPSGAFIYRKGRYTPLDAVDGLTTAHTGINNRGQLVGSFSPDGATLRGFVRDERGSYTRFDAAPGVITLALDINDRGTVVGTYGVTEFRGFVRKPNGSVTTIDVPGASSTFVVGINDRGPVVGSYVDADGREHGFLLERGKMTVIDHPDSPDDPAASNTAASDINDRGQILLPAPGAFYKGRAVSIGG
jgi:uncharacterized membrane protein